MRSKIKIREASGLFAVMMQIFRIDGFIGFWGTIYVPPGRVRDRRLVGHKMKHVEQMQRDGTLMFTLQYIWWLLRYGYTRHPYEVEARQAENETDRLRLY